MSWKSLYSLWCSLSECGNMTFFFHFIIYKTLNAGAEIEAFFFLLLPSNLYCLHALKHWHMSIYKDAGSREGRNWTDRTRQMLINCWNVNTHIFLDCCSAPLVKWVIFMSYLCGRTQRNPLCMDSPSVIFMCDKWCNSFRNTQRYCYTVSVWAVSHPHAIFMSIKSIIARNTQISFAQWPFGDDSPLCRFYSNHLESHTLTHKHTHSQRSCKAVFSLYKIIPFSFRAWLSRFIFHLSLFNSTDAQ